MGSITERYFHGPHCYWAACQHPCCWEAERRLAKGIVPPEMKPLPRECTTINDELPTLTVVDVSQWTREEEKPSILYENNTTLACADCHQSQSCRSLRPVKEQYRKSERTLKLPPLTCMDSTNQNKTQIKLNTAWIEPLTSCPSNTSDMPVIGIPNPGQTLVTLSHNSEERPKSPHVAVKEIFCLPPSETLIKSNIRKKSTGVKKRVRFQLAFSQSVSPLMASVSPEQFRVLGHTAGCSQATDESQPSSPSDVQGCDAARQRPSSAFHKTKGEGLLMLRNRPVVFHDIKEKRQRKVPGDVRTVYKLDYKNGEEDVDWQNLRAQAYLWKKYNLSNNQETIKDKAIPAEGATAPFSPQQAPNFYFSADRQAEAPHQKCTSEETFPHPQQSSLISQTRSILKQSPKNYLNTDSRNPLHLYDGYEDEGPGSVIPSTPLPLQSEECLAGDKTEADPDTSGARVGVGAGLRHSLVTPTDFHSPASNKKLQWADLERARPTPEVSCLGPAAPPPSFGARQRKSPPITHQ